MLLRAIACLLSLAFCSVLFAAEIPCVTPGEYWKCPVYERPGSARKPGFTVRMQGRYSLTQDGPDKPTWGLMDDHQSGDGYNTRRIRLTYTDQFRDDLVGFAQVSRDWGADEFTILDTYLTYGGWEPAKITLGQAFVPFGREFPVSDVAIPLAERSLAGVFLSPQRDIGLLLHDSRATPNFGWSAGVFGGDGINDLSFHDSYMLAARAEYTVIPELNVGLGIYDNNGSTKTAYSKLMKKNSNAYGLDSLYKAQTADESGWTVDLLYRKDGTQAFAGYVNKDVSGPGTDFSADGWYLYGGHYVPFNGEDRKLELVAGVQGFDPNTDVQDQLDATWYTFGFTWHTQGTKRQWRLNYTIRDEKNAHVDNNTLMLEYDHIF